MKTIRISLVISSALFAFSIGASARENIGMVTGSSSTVSNQLRSVEANCANATAQIDLDINNVRAKILNGGDMWWDIFGAQNAAYQIPKITNSDGSPGKGPSSQFASSIWVGGYDVGGNLKTAAQTYRQTGNDYWPGPLTSSATTDAATCLAWDKFWKINKDDVVKYYDWANGGGGNNPIAAKPEVMDIINTWPAFGPDGQPLAPFYDNNGDGFYDPSYGSADVPDFDVTGLRGCAANLYGDQNIFWVFNDKGNVHTETGRPAIGLEIQAQAFAFQSNDEINNATFLKYKIINKSSFELDSTFFGLWDDADLGYYLDDYVGCDVGLGLGILYNGRLADGTGQITAYGANPPAIGVDFFEGPFKDANGIDDSAKKVPASFLNYGDGIVDNERLGMCKFVYFDNTASTVNGNPTPGDDVYQYLTATWRNGQRITYGGNGTTTTGHVCDYMFPGTSDFPSQGHTGFYGTDGVPQAQWDEFTVGNTPNDRRFVESAGPFKLKPGAVNYVTVGVPWARATQGGNLTSVALLKGADSKVQKLFNNCFSNIEGPRAPNLVIQELNNELILTWSNPKGSNNNPKDTSVHPPLTPVYHNETYSEDYDKSTNTDSLYRFQGYQIFQLKDQSVTITDLYNPDKARLVFQCDKKDGIKQIVNYKNDPLLSALVPQEMVNGADKGIVHSISIRDDKFASGNTNLVNFKSYYFAIIAYAYSPTQVPTNTGFLQDYSPYIAGNKSSDIAFAHVGIPHKPSPEAYGTQQNVGYGGGPKITRIEGQGNGGNVVDLTSETVSNILNSTDNRVIHPTYDNAHGPVDIKVVDPLNVPVDTKFRLIMHSTGTTNKIISKNSTWDLVKVSNNCNCPNDTVHSESTIEIPNEQIINGQPSGLTTSSIPKWGLSVNISFTYDPGPTRSEVVQLPGGGTQTNYFFEHSDGNNAFLEATMTFSDPSKQWLTGLRDRDGDQNDDNWIRAGTNFPKPATHYDDYAGTDELQAYEKVLGGTWAPYRLCGFTALVTATAPLDYIGGPGFGPASNISQSSMRTTASVDVIFTSNKNLWTRCPVLEMQEETANAIGGAKKLNLRISPSVDKNGSATFGTPDNNDYATGMGWFPGYAINVETGERLNMAFGEDSFLPTENGADMKWNPTARTYGAQGVPIFGGKHYIYVFGHNGDVVYSNDQYMGNGRSNIDRYDKGKSVHDLIEAGRIQNAAQDNLNTYKKLAFRDAMWVNIPLLVYGHSLLETDVKVRLRVSKSYLKGYSTNGYYPANTTKVTDLAANPINDNFGLYEFDTRDIGTLKNNNDAAANALDIINVVPNPYYAYSGYETKTSDNIVKIINLPERCTITIYTINGTLIRKFNKADSNTYLNWDLQNQQRIPIASGLYIIHVEVPEIGDRTLKWFGVMRPLDLEAY